MHMKSGIFRRSICFLKCFLKALWGQLEDLCRPNLAQSQWFQIDAVVDVRVPAWQWNQLVIALLTEKMWKMLLKKSTFVEPQYF